MGQGIKSGKAHQQAKQNPQAALKTAEGISDPWFRCQALASVARYCDESQVLVVAEKALTSSRHCRDEYQVVASAAWPIRALIERDQQAAARRELARVLKAAVLISNPLRKADALFLLWEAAAPMGVKASRVALDLLVDACLQVKGWRGPKMLKDAAVILASFDAMHASRVAEMIPDARVRRQAQAALSAKAHVPPRPFL